MHIPDGFLDLKTAAASAALSLAGVGWAVREASRVTPPSRQPLMGLAAAFIFAAQMLNFPVWAGTSGHLIGSVLAAVLLGPSAAVVTMSAVLIVQCFLFSDGGLLALGANVFNMALVAPIAGYTVYRGVARIFNSIRGRLLAAVFAGWCSTVLAALSCAAQLAFSGTAKWQVVFPAMVNVHLLIGVGEGLITGLILLAILRARPELIDASPASTATMRGSIVPALLICAGMALFLAPHASSWPDGLEKVAEHLGFADRVKGGLALPVPMADYQMPGMSSSTWATGLAGLAGTAMAFILSWMFARWAIPDNKAK